MTDIKCPCKDCICIPICRHKPFNTLFHDCINITGYEPKYRQPTNRNINSMNEIVNTLEPTLWSYKRSYKRDDFKNYIYIIVPKRR